MKQTWSFQRWRKRYFRLKGLKLYYAKHPNVSKTNFIHYSNPLDIKITCPIYQFVLRLFFHLRLYKERSSL